MLDFRLRGRCAYCQSPVVNRILPYPHTPILSHRSQPTYLHTCNQTYCEALAEQLGQLQQVVVDVLLSSPDVAHGGEFDLVIYDADHHARVPVDQGFHRMGGGLGAPVGELDLEGDGFSGGGGAVASGGDDPSGRARRVGPPVRVGIASLEELEDVDEGPRIYHELDESLYTVSPDSFIGDLYNLLKAQNIADAALGDYPQLSEEAILDADPEVIIVPTHGVQDGSIADGVRARAGWGSIDAVQNDRIYEIDGDIVSRPGPRIVDALEQLAEMLYPERFVSQNESVVAGDDFRVAA
jgi:hypothetical protein